MALDFVSLQHRLTWTVLAPRSSSYFLQGPVSYPLVLRQFVLTHRTFGHFRYAILAQKMPVMTLIDWTEQAFKANNALRIPFVTHYAIRCF